MRRIAKLSSVQDTTLGRNDTGLVSAAIEGVDEETLFAAARTSPALLRPVAGWFAHRHHDIIAREGEGALVLSAFLRNAQRLR